jgi:hypothetical protein
MSGLLSLLMLLTPLADSDPRTPEEQAQIQLAKVRRIYIDILTGGDAALKIRDLLMTSLQNSRQFIVTEDEAKADATLRGTGTDTVFTENFQSSEGLNAHSQVGGGADKTSKTSARYMGMSIGENSSRRTEERKHEAIATVRLVNRDGDIIWSATAESLGGKFLGASADVADKISKHLVLDYMAARKLAGK